MGGKTFLSFLLLFGLGFFNTFIASSNIDEIYLNKCCPTGSYYDTDLDSCLHGEISKSVVLEDSLTFNAGEVEILGDFPPSGNSTFRLKSYLPKEACTNGYFLLDISLKNGTEIFTSDGQLKIQDEYFSAPEFCLTGASSDKISVRVCNPICTRETPCIKKCCPLNQLWSETGKCVGAEGKYWRPEVFENIFKGTKYTGKIYPHFKISPPKLWCNPLNYPVLLAQENPLLHFWEFRMNYQGKIYGRVDPLEAKELQSEFICIDGNASAEINSMGFVRSVLFDCTPRTKPNREKPLIYGILMIFSCICLLLTIFVRAIHWRSTNNHRWLLVLLSYSSSLFFMYFFFVIRFFWLLSADHGNDSFCYFVGVGWNFSFLTTFSWLSVVSFDHWWTFKSMVPCYKMQGSNFIKSYVKYAAFPTIFSSVTVGVALALDRIYGNDYNSFVITPNYGRDCYLRRYFGEIAYAYGPVGILLLCNVTFFIVTVVSLIRVQRSTKMAMENATNFNQRASILILGKLLVVMGVPWIFEVISWFVNSQDSGSNWYWMIFDLINSLQGVAILWIFVRKSDLAELFNNACASCRCGKKFTMDGKKARKIKNGHVTLSPVLTPTSTSNCK